MSKSKHKVSQRYGETPLGLYLHVPFCSTSCDFCGFYQIQSDRKGILSYIDGVKRELELVDVGSRKIDTMFWGGGTPGLLPAADMLKVGSSITDALGMPTQEWTVEMAPSSVKRDKLEALKEAGVTRISMGIQSLNERLLEALGRQHSLKQIHKAYDLIREVGFRSVNVDLIFAIPTQTEEEWRADVRGALALQPDHLSTYCLTFEEDTALFIKLQQGKVSIDPDREARFYTAMWEEAENGGFQQYEISNYARPGHQCLHNVNTWRMAEWIGIGPSGSSQWEGSRHTNTPDLKDWLAGLERGERGLVDRTELSDGLLLEDSLIFGLRMNEGVDLAALERRFGRSLRQVAFFDQLVEEGKALREGDVLRLTPEGRMVADAVGEALLGCFG
ncbi:radical SAM family heme chaperone HemW [Pelagicoccus enzymogenes]|uniref:radical SAM family heme chaperone HemW n=1 Tax=Pelagicoccus enzymogenes TaxID=2773457 RepID=UPI00280C5ED8|nr:radical SAM family heme chaperone HemW [Pelagicoccus enzymogenes]MDQ8200784.1 radical SAM family heme chaperone HemW [Pelagicoccus enzymogenes]